MQPIIYLGLFLPLLGALILGLSSKNIGRRTASTIGCTSIFGAFLCFSWLLYVYTQENLSPQFVTLYQWIPVAGINADFNLCIDPLSLLMTLIITGVGFLIHLYSVGYMDHDKDFARFFCFLNFFVFAMLLLVLAGNLLLLFIGWEGVGMASYLLIGFWYELPVAAQSATKAFVVNRIGDYGFLLGILLMLFLFGTTDIEQVSQRVGSEFTLGAPILTVLTLLLFVGAIGKSAQLPLQVWLPDAMAGPTPVSALIHAATMVTAGVYLVVRLHPLFLMTPLTLHIVGIIGGLTALFASLCALGQTDLKRVLAYSTVSQLGLMFLACGVGAFYAAMFHLTTHAFVKGLLFLSAGNVVHMMHGTTEMGKMGGLSKIFKKTHWMFLIGALALSGIPPFAAFFSKDLILEEEYLTGFHTLFFIGLFASILTGVYMIRAYYLTFRGVSHVEPALLNSIKEAPFIMLLPAGILAILATVGGCLGSACETVPALSGFLAEVGVTLPVPEGSFFSPGIILEMFCAIFSVTITYFVYMRYADRMRANLLILKKSFYIDGIYWNLFVVPLRALSLLIANFFEPEIFDGSIHGAAGAVNGSAKALQRMQSGQIRSYVAWMVLGVSLVIIFFVYEGLHV